MLEFILYLLDCYLQFQVGCWQSYWETYQSMRLHWMFLILIQETNFILSKVKQCWWYTCSYQCFLFFGSKNIGYIYLKKIKGHYICKVNIILDAMYALSFPKSHLLSTLFSGLFHNLRNRANTLWVRRRWFTIIKIHLFFGRILQKKNGVIDQLRMETIWWESVSTFDFITFF